MLLTDEADKTTVHFDKNHFAMMLTCQAQRAMYPNEMKLDNGQKIKVSD